MVHKTTSTTVSKPVKVDFKTRTNDAKFNFIRTTLTTATYFVVFGGLLSGRSQHHLRGELVLQLRLKSSHLALQVVLCTVCAKIGRRVRSSKYHSYKKLETIFHVKNFTVSLSFS